LYILYRTWSLTSSLIPIIILVIIILFYDGIRVILRSVLPPILSLNLPPSISKNSVYSNGVGLERKGYT
jgi:hypothetical protein